MAVQPISLDPAPRGGGAARPQPAGGPADLFATLLRGHWRKTEASTESAPERREPTTDSIDQADAPIVAGLAIADPAAETPFVPDPAPTPGPATADAPVMPSPTAAPGPAVADASPVPDPAALPAAATAGVLSLSISAAPPAQPVSAPSPPIQATAAVPPPLPAPAAPSTPGSTASADAPTAAAPVPLPAPDRVLDSLPDRLPVEFALVGRAARSPIEPPTPGMSAPTAAAIAADLPKQIVRPAAPAQIAGLAAMAPGAVVALAAQQVGEAAHAAAPGRTKTAGEPATAGGNPLARAVTEATPAAGQPPTPGTAPSPSLQPAAESIVADLAAGASAKAEAAGLGSAAAPPAGLAGPTPTDQPATAPGGRAAAPPPPLPEQLSVHIQKAVHAGADRISVQLRPAELGRIEVRLEFARDGRLSANVVADRAETLDLLLRDARGLERSLQDAGLKADSGSLTFNLRGDGRQDFGQALDRRPADPVAAPSEAPAPDIPQAAAPPAPPRHPGAIDIRV